MYEYINLSKTHNKFDLNKFSILMKNYNLLHNSIIVYYIITNYLKDKLIDEETKKFSNNNVLKDKLNNLRTKLNENDIASDKFNNIYKNIDKNVQDNSTYHKIFTEYQYNLKQ